MPDDTEQRKETVENCPMLNRQVLFIKTKLLIASLSVPYNPPQMQCRWSEQVGRYAAMGRILIELSSRGINL
jgi:hypothetical protein